jgi:hypothetical protein
MSCACSGQGNEPSCRRSRSRLATDRIASVSRFGANAITVFSDGAVMARDSALAPHRFCRLDPNNLMIIREGLVRGRVVAVATAVWVSYVLLLALAMTFGGLSKSIGATMQMWLSLGGVLALSWFDPSVPGCKKRWRKQVQRANKRALSVFLPLSG